LYYVLLFFMCLCLWLVISCTIEPGYNDIGLYDSQMLCATNYVVTVNHNIILLGYNDTRL
jgi:hypothetical protein